MERRPRRVQPIPYLAAGAAALALIGVTSVTSQPASPVVTRQVATGTAPGAATSGSPVDPSAIVPGGATATGPGQRAQAGRAAPATVAGAGPVRANRVYDPGVTDDTILVGGSTFTSGPAAVYGEQIAVGFQAGVNYINDRGGINGRRVIAKIYDDAGDPARQLANTKRLVEVDKAFALSMVYAPIAGDYVLQQGLPVYHLGQFNEEFVNPWWYSVGGAQRTSSYAIADFGANYVGAKSVAIFYLDVGAANYSRAYAEDVKRDWEAWGVRVPVLVGFAADQTSCSDALSQARNAAVDFIDFEIDASKVINCGVGAQVQGYRPPKGWGGYLIGVPVVPEALGEFSIGMYAFDAFGALYTRKEYQEAVRKVSSKTEWYSSVTSSYFVAALLMRDSIGKLGDTITRTKLRDTLDTFTRWQPDIVAGEDNFPWYTWRPDCHLALHGGYAIEVRKQPDGSLRWTQITPQIRAVALPPNTAPPPEWARCDTFTNGTVFGRFKP